MDTAPNVLFLLSDQHNPRYLSHVDDPPDEPVATPRLSALAENGAELERTYCQSPICTPSRICMLTGRSVLQSGGWSNHSRIRPGTPTLPGTFSEAGYETCLVGKMHLGGDRQFCGFDNRPYGDITGTTGHQFEPLFDSPPDYNPRKGAGKEYASKYQEEGALKSILTGAGITEIPESLLQEYNVVLESLSFLREHEHDRPETPWFLCASFSRPHSPFTAPRRHFERYWPDGTPAPRVSADDTPEHPYTRYLRDLFDVAELDEETLAKARAAYFACVSYLDEILADMLSALQREGFLENTIVVYASDHGEMAGEHGLWGKRTWYEGSTRVPWFVQLPEHRSGAVDPASISTPVSLADLFPTLCGLCGIESPDGLDGVDLSESIYSGDEPDRGPVVCDLFERGGGTYRMVRDGPYKYVHFAEHGDLLFDLSADPLERENRLATAEAGDDERIEELRRFATDSVDFDEVERRRERDKTRDRKHDLEISQGHGNAYLMPDGRLVDADTPLYRPYVLARDPSKVFEDWPDDE